MSKKEKLFQKICYGNKANIAFPELVNFLILLGFECRIKGDHYIFTKENVVEIINIQPDKNNMAKIYEINQIRNIIKKYNMEV